MSKHYVDEVGSIIIVNTGIDLSGASTHQLKVKKPDGTTVTWNASVYSVGSNPNYLKYTSVSGDLDQAGEYKVQPYVVLSSWSGCGETSRFNVTPLFA